MPILLYGSDPESFRRRWMPFVAWGLAALGAGIVLLPRAPLLTIMYLSQVLNGVLLPAVLIFILILVNDKRLMGKHRNNRFYNVVSVGVVVILAGLTVILALTTIWPGLLG